MDLIIDLKMNFLQKLRNWEKISFKEP